MLCNPELASTFVPWTELIRRLLSMSVLTISCGYTNSARCGPDAILDEKILHDFFNAR
jgi:hypothetical protein